MNVLRLAVAGVGLLAACAAQAQMKSGVDIPGFGETMGIDAKAPAPAYAVQFIRSSAPANVLWPGEQASFTFQVTNPGEAPLAVAGKVEVIAYGTRGRPNDIWVPDMFRTGVTGAVPVEVNLAAGGFQNVTVEPRVPERFGAYALIVDLGPAGRRFVTSFVRTFRAESKPVRFPQLCMDNDDPVLLTRLGAAPNRIGIGYKPTTDPDFEEWYKRQGEALAAYKAAGLAITVEFGGGAFYHTNQPLGRPRPWLDDKGVMLDTKFDLAWLPAWDADFRQFCKRFAADYGWPKGPVNGFKLWNEPWNGISISGWGADDWRYREIYTALCEGVEEARREAGVQPLLGGCDSSSNTFDKFFGDGSPEFLKWLDFCSIHYQGMAPPSTVKAWMNRQHPNGRVLIWDTESWVANTDDRVATVVATNLSTGHDRAVGIYHGNVATEWHSRGAQIRGEDGKPQQIEYSHTWSVAAAVGATTHFIGERRFRELLFRNGLPWVMVFDGNLGTDGKPLPEDGTVVVIGDIGEAFGADNVLFRTARGVAEIANRKAAKAKLAVLPAGAPEDDRKALEMAANGPQALSGATLTLADGGGRHALFDCYGNPMAAADGRLGVPLDHRGFFLRGDGSPGSFAGLLEALRASRIDGIEPLAKESLDFTARIAQRPALRLRLTNVLNRPIKGSLRVTVGGLTLAEAERTVAFAANETKVVEFRVTGGEEAESNTYPLRMVYDAGDDGISEHEEDVHVNLIARRTIAVDGKLDDWTGVPVQTVTSAGVKAPTLQEFAWQPFKTFDTAYAKGYAAGWLAYDDQYLYFAAKVADSTPEGGMRRYETLDEAAFFYPEKCYAKPDARSTAISVRWTGKVVPRFSEEYTFLTVTDDGARLWVDGKPLVDDWSSHGDKENQGKIALEAGKAYDIRFEYYDGGGGATARLLWASASQPKEVIPAAALRSGAAPDAAPGLTGEYFRGIGLSGASAKRVEAPIDFHPNRGNTPEAIWTEGVMEEYTWPEGIRRYSYRQDPDLPAGNAPNHDNVQIAFNVLPEEKKPWAMNPPGTMAKYAAYWCTDYEYALNPVAERYGGGTEIWPLRRPDLPNKHYYPHSPKAADEGPVKDGRLVVLHDGNTRIVECALPWREIPHVKRALDEGRTVKFSFRVNDNAGAGCMELSRGRSVAKRNGAFKVDWTEHWANELEFAFERP